MQALVKSQKPVVMACDCYGLDSITVKSAAAKDKPRCTNIPFNTKNNGAAYQDAKYGKGKRLHNIAGKGKELGEKATCTICGVRKLR